MVYLYYKKGWLLEMKLFKEVKKYTWVIVVICLIGLNAHNINKNTQHLNSNATATIQLSKGVGLLADTFTWFIKTYVKNNNFINEQVKELAYRELQNKTNIMINQMEHYALKKGVENLHKKPAFEYLKSVTVFIVGEPTSVNKIKNFLLRKKTSAWCGTGVIVKIDKDYTYILTNEHVATSDNPCAVFIGRNKKTRKKVIEVKTHDAEDLALIKIKGQIEGKQVIKGLAFPTITEKVYNVGHSLARPFIYGEGVFSGTTLLYDVYQLPTIGGQSGSGVFNANGELLGLICSNKGIRIRGQIAWDFTRGNCVKGVYVKEFLEENL